MNSLKAGLFEILFRIKEKAPKFFRKFQAYAAAGFALALLITEKFPELNPVIFVFNKGEAYQDVVRLMTAIGAVNLGFIGASQLTLRQPEKSIMQAKKEDIKLGA
jgi:hypothetical protein